LAKPVEGGKLIMGTSNPASCKESDGGVARNIAEVLGRLGSKPLLYSVVGNDSRGLSMLHRLSTEYGIQASPETVRIVDSANTATYIAVMNEKGDLHTACADMAVFDVIQPPPQNVLDQAEILVLDANPPVHILHQAALYAKRAGVKVLLEPTSVAKALAVARDDSLMSCLTFATPNVDELSAMADGWSTTEDDHDILLYDGDLSLVKPLAEKVIRRMNSEAYLLVTVGAKGCLLATKKSATSEITFERFPAKKVLHVRNATGAGDTLAGSFVNALLKGKTVPEAVVAGIEAATLSLECQDSAISPSISDLAT
jgi:pseudouridine kinase